MNIKHVVWADDEIDLLNHIRKQFNADQLEIRVDANGAFKSTEALSKIDQLSKFILRN